MLKVVYQGIRENVDKIIVINIDIISKMIRLMVPDIRTLMKPYDKRQRINCVALNKKELNKQNIKLQNVALEAFDNDLKGEDFGASGMGIICLTLDLSFI